MTAERHGVEHFIVPYSETPLTDRRPTVAGVSDGPAGTTLVLRDQNGNVFSVPLGRRVEVGTRWELQRLGAGVWTVLPAVKVTGRPSVFITLTDCPEPAPWAATQAPFVGART